MRVGTTDCDRGSTISQDEMPTFVIYTRRTAEVLPRVVSMFHQRRVHVDRLAMEDIAGAAVVRITVRFRADRDKALNVEANLYRLVDVLLVERDVGR